MTDPATRRPIRVSTDGTSRPYIMVSVELLEKVRKLLVENEVDLAIMGTPPRHLETTAFPFARHPLVESTAPDAEDGATVATLAS